MKRFLSAVALGLALVSTASAARPYTVNNPGFAYGGVIIINQPAPAPRPIVVAPAPRPLTIIESERLSGVYRGSNAATAPYAGGPKTTYNPFCNQKPLK